MKKEQESKGKEVFDVLRYSIESLSKKEASSIENDILFEFLKLSLDALEKKYKKEKSEIVAKINEGPEMELPCSIFSKKLGVLESIVTFLKEEKKMSYHEIAKTLNRDDRTIWVSYKKAKEKEPKKQSIDWNETKVPIVLFSDRKKPLMNILVTFLKDSRNLNYKKIAEKIKRDQRNVWQAYHYKQR